MKKITSKIPVVGIEKKGEIIFLNFDIDDQFMNKKSFSRRRRITMGQI